jgi:high affinity Mn2+ porin
MKKLSILIIIIYYGVNSAQEKDTLNRNYSYHFQQTIVDQMHGSFNSLYSGLNSLNHSSESALSITSTLFLGWMAPAGIELYFNPELSGGSGLSSTRGVAGFPNGEVYRVDDPQPKVTIARFFIRKVFDLRGNDILIDDGPNQLFSRYASHRLALTLGKFSLSDLFDDNSYSHDARSQFLNWSLMSSAAWDYPADTKGYTYGLALEYIRPEFTLRGAAVMVSREVNGIEMDTNIKDAFGIVIELEKPFILFENGGKIRFLLFQNHARMGSYSEVLNDPGLNMDINLTRIYGRTKTGFAVNTEYSLGEKDGAFLKFSWNDGKNESWMFTEVDRSLAGGIQFQKLNLLNRSDEAGLALVLNGLSDVHERFLMNGGYGFIIGDGKLNYGLESIIELYFKTIIYNNVSITPDYQFVLNPGYNKDRGPVHLFALRVHIEL